jgi:hypothetical protein
MAWGSAAANRVQIPGTHAAYINGMRQHPAFLQRSGGGNWPGATLIDTELRENFREDNTRRKSFLGHAHGLTDLPIEAATSRPTQRFAAHGYEFRWPTAGDGRCPVTRRDTVGMHSVKRHASLQPSRLTAPSAIQSALTASLRLM